jgi:hypothetical protein
LWYSRSSDGIFRVTLTEKNIKLIKVALVTVVVYGLILLNTNDIIISVVFFGHSVLYVVLEELYFFIKNAQDIEKTLSRFNSKKRQKESLLDEDYNHIDKIN